MTLVKKRHSPFFPAFMDELFRPDLGGRQMNFNVPPVNVTETENAFEVSLSAPGKAREDFNIELDKNLLTISSDVKSENKEENVKYTRREFTLASFKRSFTLPETVSSDDIKAVYENGILKITLPKKEEALPKAKRMIDVL